MCVCVSVCACVRAQVAQRFRVCVYVRARACVCADGRVRGSTDHVFGVSNNKHLFNAAATRCASDCWSQALCNTIVRQRSSRSRLSKTGNGEGNRQDEVQRAVSSSARTSLSLSGQRPRMLSLSLLPRRFVKHGRYQRKQPSRVLGLAVSLTNSSTLLPSKPQTSCSVTPQAPLLRRSGAHAWSQFRGRFPTPESAPPKARRTVRSKFWGPKSGAAFRPLFLNPKPRPVPGAQITGWRMAAAWQPERSCRWASRDPSS